MPDVLIVVDSLASATTTQMVSALKSSILSERECISETTVAAIESSQLRSDYKLVTEQLFCPLTLALPETLPFAAQALYAACRDTEALRLRLESWHYAIGAGAFWLPIVLTAKGPLYAEVIGAKVDKALTTQLSEPFYEQPIHLSDVQRQPLYALGQRLLQALTAPPAVYLMQFGWQQDAPCFDRLLPFPAAPAIASLNVQTPDLFACHWYCLTGKPLLDLAISSLR